MSRITSAAIWLAGLALLVFGLIMIDGRATNLHPSADPMEKCVELNSATLSMLSVGNRPLVADYLWIDAVQYLGKTLAQHHHEIIDGKVVCVGFPAEKLDRAAEIFYELANRTVEVDPHFTYVHYMGALFLNDPHTDPDRAVNLLHTGILNNPKDWQLRFWFAYLNLMLKRDRETALEHMKLAAEMEGCPQFVLDIRDRLFTAPDRQLATMFLAGMLQKARSEMERKRIRQQMDELDSGVDLRQLLHDHHAHDHDHHHGHD